MLEDLNIRANVNIEDDIVVNVDAPALKRLQLNLVAFLWYEYFESPIVLSRNKIVINAPVLEDLILEHDCLACYSLNNLSSLVSALIDVGNCCMQDTGMKEHANQIFKLLEGITNVEFLTLETTTMGVLDFADDNKLPLFPNLIHLKLVIANDYSWRRLPDLLCSPPNLSDLVLWKSDAHEGRDMIREFGWVEPQRTPTCFLSSLEKLVVIRFRREGDELKLLKYFLENGELLKEVVLGSFHLTLEKKRNFFEKVVKFRMVSKTCLITFSDSPEWC